MKVDRIFLTSKPLRQWLEDDILDRHTRNISLNRTFFCIPRSYGKTQLAKAWKKYMKRKGGEVLELKGKEK